MTAKQNIIIEISLPKGTVKCSISIPYWWEEQECKRSSIIRNQESGHVYMDKSKFHMRLADLILESVDTGSSRREKDPSIPWSKRLKYGVIKPLNDAYEKMCSEEMLNFKEEVEMFLSPEKRPEGIFVAPPEVIEYLLMKRIGGLSRQDIRSMSYVEMHKFQIVGNVMAEMSGGGVSAPQMQTEKSGGIPHGLIHSDLLGDPTLSASQVKAISDLSTMG